MAREIVISLAVSPAGRLCIDMIVGEGRYILLTTKRWPRADGLIQQLIMGDWHPTIGKIDACAGIGFDWRASLERQELIWNPDFGTIGVYVPEDRYDELVEMLGENNL